MGVGGGGILVAIFYVLDSINLHGRARAVGERETVHETWKFDGLPNLFFLAVILGAVFLGKPIFLRETIMFAAALGSYFTTNKNVHEANHFSFHPIREVAVLFAGIFATMMPALYWLAANARELLGAN